MLRQGTPCLRDFLIKPASLAQTSPPLSSRLRSHKQKPGTENSAKENWRKASIGRDFQKGDKRSRKTCFPETPFSLFEKCFALIRQFSICLKHSVRGLLFLRGAGSYRWSLEQGKRNVLCGKSRKPNSVCTCRSI